MRFTGLLHHRQIVPINLTILCYICLLSYCAGSNACCSRITSFTIVNEFKSLPSVVQRTGELSVMCPSCFWTLHWSLPLPVQWASCAAASYWTVAPSIISATNKLDCLLCLLLSTHFYFLIYLFFNVPSWPRVCEQGKQFVSVQPANQI